MKKNTLSILIPARNEQFLAKTVENLLENIEGDTEIIVALDGQWSSPGLPQDEKVTVIYFPESIGQRAATNQACRLSNARWIMKVDAHCSFDKGFDVKMMQDMKDDWTMVPVMKNLHAFDWVCKCGHRIYQGPTPEKCPKCGEKMEREILWKAKDSPNSVSYCFNTEPKFQYFKEFSKRPEGQGDITPTMSLQGSCFMMTRDKYWELDVCNEDFGSWGSQGIEVATKTWTSGGQVMCNKKTWYAHMFRTQGGDFSFPYSLSGNQVSRAKKHAKDLFFNGKWDKQKYPLSWLIKKFWPVQGWEQKDLDSLLVQEEIDNEKTGVYAITCKENNKIYIGSTEKLNEQFNIHLALLCENKHVNKHLQYAWNRYKEDSFSFKILQFCSKEKLLNCTHDVINTYKKEINWKCLVKI